MTTPHAPAVHAPPADDAATNTAETAKRLYRAFAARDRAEAERLIAADFRFTSPLDNRIDRAAYFSICWPNSETMAGFDFVHVAEADARAFVTYEGRTKAGKRFRNTEVLTVRDGQVTEVEVYFGWDLPHEAAPGTHIDPK